MSATTPPALAGKDTIRIAVPIADGCFAEHFGGARAFLMFEGNTTTRRCDVGVLLEAPEHKPGALPKFLARQYVDAVVVSAIGERALNILEAVGIEVFLAAGDPDPAVLASACLTGSLVRATRDNTRCHGHHDHDGHECHHH